MAQDAQNLEDLLGELGELAERDRGGKTSFEEVYEAIGERSYGPLLLICGLFMMTPVAAIPTAPSILAVVTILIAVQILFGRERLWIPKRLLKLSIKAEKLEKTVRITRKPARFVDKLVRPRMSFLTIPPVHRVVALAAILVALCVPPLELLPFAAIIPAFAIAAFGLGLIARDGLLILIAGAISLGGIGFAAYKLLT
jgi:hypothetical protein